MPRLHVDWTRCDGHGSCVELLPELLDSDEWGFPIARGSQEVPLALVTHAEHAARTCPLSALSLVRTR